MLTVKQYCNRYLTDDMNDLRIVGKVVLIRFLVYLSTYLPTRRLLENEIRACLGERLAVKHETSLLTVAKKYVPRWRLLKCDLFGAHLSTTV